MLGQLEKAGLVSVHQEATTEGGRVSRTFAITPAGKARFHTLMLDTASSPREYRTLFAFKVTSFDRISSAERVALLEHYLDFVKAHLRHLDVQGADLQNSPGYGHSSRELERFSSVFGHLTDGWQSELDWAARLLEEETKGGAAPRAHRPKTR